MRKRGVLASLLLALTSTAAAEPTLDDGTRVGKPVTHENLTLLPLVGPEAQAADDYLVLDEGMERGLVQIVERGNGGSVNELIVVNRGKKPLFLMSGEVILGGQQDRIIGKDTVVPAGKRQEVAVYCVEHGRWAGNDKRFRSAKVMAHTKLRKQASYADQSAVWKEVGVKNKVRGTENATDTYRRVATEKSVDDAIAPYARTLGKALGAAEERERVVGVAVALNGKVVAIEQFDSPRLFAKVSAKILRSYYVDAVDAPRDAAAKPATAEDVVAFARREKDTAAELVAQDGARKTERMSGKGLQGTKVMDASKSDPAKPVYKSLHAE